METFTHHQENQANETAISDIKSLKNKASRYIAIHFYLSRLMPYNRQPHQIRKAYNDINNIFASFQGRSYYLRNDDFVYIIENPSIIQLERCITQFKRYFNSDPLIANNIRREQFYSTYTLSNQFDLFLNSISEIEENIALRSAMTLPEDALTSTPLLLEGIKVDTLNQVQNILHQSDLSNHLRRQTICWYDGKSPPKPMSQHFYFSLPSLQETLKLNESIEGNMWLFRQFTLSLDRQMLRHIREFLTYKSLASFHVNLSLRTIITSHFQNLIKDYHQQKAITFEIDIVDALAHPDVLLFTYNFLKERKAYVCLNGIEAGILDLLKVENLLSDYFKINWSARLKDRLQEFQNFVDLVGNERLILHKCDSQGALDFGLNAGIRLFQGNFIDQLLKLAPQS